MAPKRQVGGSNPFTNAKKRHLVWVPFFSVRLGFEPKGSRFTSLSPPGRNYKLLPALAKNAALWRFLNALCLKGNRPRPSRTPQKPQDIAVFCFCHHNIWIAPPSPSVFGILFGIIFAKNIDEKSRILCDPLVRFPAGTP